MSVTDQQQEEQTSRYSNLTYLSFGMYQLAWTILVSSLGLFLYFYYHAVIGLDPLMIFTKFRDHEISIGQYPFSFC